MAIVTITRQFGGGGSDVAQRAAAALGWTLIDNDFVALVAREAGLPPETVAAHEERAPSLRERLVRALATASPEVFVPGGPSDELDEEALLRVTQRVIAEAAAAGRVVLVGRGAQAFLASARQDDALHVYVVAPHAARVFAVMERLGVDAKQAELQIQQTDADRDRYVDRNYGRIRQDPANYHLVVNTGWLGCDGAADLVAAAVRGRGWA